MPAGFLRRRREEGDPPIKGLNALRGLAGPIVFGCAQRIDVFVFLECEQRADRRCGVFCDAPLAEDRLHERPARPAVAVAERVDQLELGVGHSRRRDRVVAGFVDVAEKVVEQHGHVFNRRSDVCGGRISAQHMASGAAEHAGNPKRMWVDTDSHRAGVSKVMVIL